MTTFVDVEGKKDTRCFQALCEHSSPHPGPVLGLVGGGADNCRFARVKFLPNHGLIEQFRMSRLCKGLQTGRQ